MLLLHNSCRYSSIDSSTAFSPGLYPPSLTSVSPSVKAVLTALAVLMIWIPPITRTALKNAKRWMNKESHSIYVHIDFCQLSIVVSPDLLVTRHFPPRVRRVESALSFPRLWCVSENKSRQQFRRRRWDCRRRAQAPSASDPLSTAHNAPLQQRRECFPSVRASESPGLILPRGLDATEPLSPPLSTSLTPPPYRHISLH